MYNNIDQLSEVTNEDLAQVMFELSSENCRLDISTIANTSSNVTPTSSVCSSPTAGISKPLVPLPCMLVFDADVREKFAEKLRNFAIEVVGVRQHAGVEEFFVIFCYEFHDFGKDRERAGRYKLLDQVKIFKCWAQMDYLIACTGSRRAKVRYFDQYYAFRSYNRGRAESQCSQWLPYYGNVIFVNYRTEWFSSTIEQSNDLHPPRWLIECAGVFPLKPQYKCEFLLPRQNGLSIDHSSTPPSTSLQICQNIPPFAEQVFIGRPATTAYENAIGATFHQLLNEDEKKPENALSRSEVSQKKRKNTLCLSVEEYSPFNPTTVNLFMDKTQDIEISSICKKQRKKRLFV